MTIFLLSAVAFAVGLFFTGAEYGAQRALQTSFPERDFWWDGVIGWAVVTALAGVVVGYAGNKLLAGCGVMI